MKIAYLLVGLIIGSASGVTISKLLYKGESVSNNENDSDHVENSNWVFPDSLDAISMAPESHKIVFEDSNLRILHVIIEPNKTEPVHTHKWKSVMWFTKPAPMTYYKCDFTNNRFIVNDSISIPQMPPEVLNHGETLDAEGPHAIKNVGSQEGIAYRVEFKKDFKP